MHNRFLFLISFLFIAFTCQAQTLDENWLSYINLGKQAYAAGQLVQALDEFTKAAQTIPTDTTAYVYMLDCASRLNKTMILYDCVEKLEFTGYKKIGMYEKAAAIARDVQRDYEKAFFYLEKAKSLAPNNQRLRQEEIKTWFLKGDYVKAKELTQAYLTTYPNSYNQLSILLHILFEVEKNYPEVLSLLTKAIGQFPDSLYLRELEANVYLMTGDKATAEAKFEAIIKINPNDPKAYYNLALLYFDKDEGEKVVEYYNKAIALDTTYVDAIYNLGIYYYYWGLSYNQALSEMSVEQYLEQSKEVTASAIENLKMAKPYFEKVTRLRPEELDAYENLNTINVLLGNLENNLQASSEIHVKHEPAEKMVTEKMENSDIMAEKMESSDMMDDLIAPELILDDLEIQYPSNDTAGLHKGETGYIHFLIANRGNANAGGLEAVIMEPVSIPELEYNNALMIRDLPIDSSLEITIPIKYLENNAQTTGIEKIQNLENKLRLFVKDSTGSSSGLQELTIKLARGSAQGSNYSKTEDIQFNPYTGGRNFLLIIAIDNYFYWPKLNNAVSDAKQVKETLLSRYRFIPDYVYELYNADASKENIRNALIKIKQDITDKDNLVIYYAGHGDYNTDFNEGAWIPCDAHTDAQEEYLPNSMLLSYLRSLQSKHIFLVADACFSGSLFVADSEVAYHEYNDKLKSRWALSSGNMEYVSDGKGGATSPFAGYLIQALKDNKRDRISVSEIVSYVKFMVKNASQQTPVGKPLRDVGNEGGDYVFYAK